MKQANSFVDTMSLTCVLINIGLFVFANKPSKSYKPDHVGPLTAAIVNLGPLIRHAVEWYIDVIWIDYS